MSSHIPPDQSTDIRSPLSDNAFLLLLVMVFIGIFGVFMLMFSFTYVKDLQTLTSVPDILWDFTCGRPNAYGSTLPLLLTMSIVCFMATGVLYMIRRRLVNDPRQ